MKKSLLWSLRNFWSRGEDRHISRQVHHVVNVKTEVRWLHVSTQEGCLPHLRARGGLQKEVKSKVTPEEEQEFGGSRRNVR